MHGVTVKFNLEDVLPGVLFSELKNMKRTQELLVDTLLNPS